MKKLICSLSLVFMSTCFANQLHNFEQIEAAVNDGKLIRLYVNYTKCNTPTNFNTIPNSAALYTPNAVAIESDGNIHAYVLYFTTMDPRYPAQPVYQYGSYHLSKDNTLDVTFTVLNAVDYKPLDGKYTIHCKIDDSAKVFVP